MAYSSMVLGECDHKNHYTFGDYVCMLQDPFVLSSAMRHHNERIYNHLFYDWCEKNLKKVRKMDIPSENIKEYFLQQPVCRYHVKKIIKGVLKDLNSITLEEFL